jgi:hypothetical protein
MPGSVAVLPYAVLRRMSSPSLCSGGLRGCDHPALARVYTSGEACP